MSNDNGLLPAAAGKKALADILLSCRSMFVGVACFSVLINVLMLTGSMFMLEVYDRALPSRSVPTLVGLLAIVCLMYLFLGALEVIRGRMLTRTAVVVDTRLSGDAYDVLLRLPLVAGRRGQGMQPIRDVDAVRGFLSGQGPTVFFDLPWVPFYLGICFLFHFWLGVAALGGVLVLAVLTVATEMLTRAPSARTLASAGERNALADRDRRNAETAHALGMTGRLKSAWEGANRSYMLANLRASDLAGMLATSSKMFRMLLQSVVLAVGALLVIRGEASAGIIIAASIISGRALAPIDLAIANWKGFVAARQAWKRLSTLTARLPPARAPMQLPAPSDSVSVEAVSVVPPGETRIVVQDVTFALQRGSALGVIGPSASGKSSLARALVGVWQMARGRLQLDGSDISQWSAGDLGRSIGYLPQDAELMSGTVADNIARFDPDATPDAVIAAAKAAGAHDMIIGFKDGFDTPVGEQGSSLSAGQRQRVALTRALYGDPFLVVLDEPNSNLDTDGDAALVRAIEAAKARGAVVIVIAHRTSVLAAVDHVLAMNNGRQVAFGPRDEILKKLIRKDPAGPGPLTVVPQGAGA